MDLSFTLKSSRRAAYKDVSLEDIKAVASQRRMDNDREQAGKLPMIRDDAADMAHILACRLVPDMADITDTEIMGGSFNPLVAHQLMVGEVGEDDVYLRDLADVQGSVA